MASPVSLRFAVLPLLERCRRNDPRAWKVLVATYQRGLFARLRWRLRTWPSHAEVAEEAAHRVWVALWSEGGRRLLAFDPQRGSFRTYLLALAADEIRRLCRERARLQAREVGFTRARQVGFTDGLSLEMELEEFQDRLSPRERSFLQELVQSVPTKGPGQSLSPSNRRKVKQRILKKLREFVA
jgi:DNA-directed RNA polymerase specialized sigma24 family protein